MIKDLNSLNKKISSIKLKRNLTESDLITINRNINNISIGLKDNSEVDNNKIGNILRETVKVVLTTPTKSNKAYRLKKDFLGNTPNIMFINMNELPDNYLKRFISKNRMEDLIMRGGGQMAEIAKIEDIPEQYWLDAPKPPKINGPEKIDGVIGCLGQVNNCPNNGRLVYDAEGIIGCNEPVNQGEQQFIYPKDVFTYN